MNVDMSTEGGKDSCAILGEAVECSFGVFKGDLIESAEKPAHIYIQGSVLINFSVAASGRVSAKRQGFGFWTRGDSHVHA